MAFPVEQLIALGLSRQVVEAWRARGVSHLLPLQEKAIAEHGFLHGRPLLVVAPTSSGKTFVAEIAALKHLEQNKRVIYLAPTKALAEEKYRAFSDLYGHLGYRVVVATRERPDSDRTVLEGRYDLLVAVYEKMKAFLVARPEMLASVALVVADEIQTLGDPGRGGTVDLLLTKICQAPYGTQLIGLSAVLGDDAQRLATWLGCDLLIHRGRPVELREGIFDLSTGKFVYREVNSRERGEENLDPTEASIGDAGEENEPADFRREAILRLAQVLAVEKGEQVLIFVPTRYISRNWAHHLASQAHLPAARDALCALARYEETFSRELLEETLREGIAFHNADLSWDLRDLIEHYFNDGAIRVLVSTSTLGQGVNLTGRNVLHVPAMVTTDQWTGRQAMTALSRARFHNQGGRSGRFRQSDGFGRSMLVARNRSEGERLLRDYVEGDIENLTPQIAPENLDIYILDLLASKIGRTAEDLVAFFHQTYSGRTLWPADAAPVARQVDRAIGELENRKLASRDPQGRLQATGLGEIAAGTGLCPSTIDVIALWLREGPKVVTQDPTEALVAVAMTDDAREFPLGGGLPGSAPWVDSLRERLLHRAEGVAPSIESALCPPGGFTREHSQDLRKVAILEEWIGPEETRAIEERHQVFSGTAANLASHFAWLVQGAAAMARSLLIDARCVQALETLGKRLVLGCGAEGVAFIPLRVQGLSRAYIQVLIREGYTTLRSLAEADRDTLDRLIPPRVAEELVVEAARRLNPVAPRSPEKLDESIAHLSLPEETAGSPNSETTADAAPEVPHQEESTVSVLLEVDLRGTGAARFQGQELDLPPLPFKLLALLARRLGTGASYTEISTELWPDCQVENQQIGAHRRRIIQSLGRFVSAEKARTMIPVKAGRGMSLSLEAGEVRVVGG
ncbi:DEAD/DEAH box helicase [bacterium]|nr:DEAD/DEAH box helicase [bacterium]